MLTTFFLTAIAAITGIVFDNREQSAPASQSAPAQKHATMRVLIFFYVFIYFFFLNAYADASA